ncbi:hypothetical protein L484_005525 [Morus notabilis]|uniref:Uncharacterized protein n=1 Tax=Morus notabilis TaxID=981085 RepID=W9QFA1_9ROSA|nr:hypothetical protein L484_005525 [Morus notabilis]
MKCGGLQKLIHATVPLDSPLLALPIEVVSISVRGTSRFSQVSLRKLGTSRLAILASPYVVVSLSITVSRHSGLTFLPCLPLA